MESITKIIKKTYYYTNPLMTIILKMVFEHKRLGFVNGNGDIRRFPIRKHLAFIYQAASIAFG